jgi:protein-tyrosine kinase
VSRIDEALRRMKAAGEETGSATRNRQAMFQPAWPTADSADAEERTQPDTARIEPKRRPSGTYPGVMSFSSAWRERLASPPDGDPGLIEQFRRLAATLHHAQQSNGLRSVMVTSASQGDGKTLTAVNLALVLAESYRSRVLLIDADLRRPSIPSVADLGDGSGLSEALRAPTEQKLALVPITSRLTLLPAGQAIANSIEALTSPRMRQILEDAATHFDWVVLDAPPVGPTADARLLTQMVGGTLFVIRAEHTQCDDVQKAIDSLGREHILGVVLNGVEGKPLEGYYGQVPTTRTS